MTPTPAALYDEDGHGTHVTGSALGAALPAGLALNGSAYSAASADAGGQPIYRVDAATGEAPGEPDVISDDLFCCPAQCRVCLAI